MVGTPWVQMDAFSPASGLRSLSKVSQWGEILSLLEANSLLHGRERPLVLVGPPGQKRA